jgi:hypothetical protein
MDDRLAAWLRRLLFDGLLQPHLRRRGQKNQPDHHRHWRQGGIHVGLPQSADEHHVQERRRHGDEDR